MYLHITVGGTELVAPQDTGSFSVRSTLAGEELAAALHRARIGTVLPSGDHVMVEVEAIRRLAVGRVDIGWADELAGMLAFAESKGWTSPDGSAVRAHVERR